MYVYIATTLILRKAENLWKVWTFVYRLSEQTLFCCGTFQYYRDGKKGVFLRVLSFRGISFSPLPKYAQVLCEFSQSSSDLLPIEAQITMSGKNAVNGNINILEDSEDQENLEVHEHGKWSLKYKFH